MVSTVRPKASETPKRPMPTWGKAAAMTALPQPAKVSQNVPSPQPRISSFPSCFLLLIQVRYLPRLLLSPSPVAGLASLQVLGQVLVHLEHSHLLLAEHRL